MFLFPDAVSRKRLLGSQTRVLNPDFLVRQSLAGIWPALLLLFLSRATPHSSLFVDVLSLGHAGSHLEASGSLFLAAKSDEPGH